MSNDKTRNRIQITSKMLIRASLAAVTLALGIASITTVAQPAWAYTCTSCNHGCNLYYSDCCGNGLPNGYACNCLFISNSYKCASYQL